MPLPLHARLLRLCDFIYGVAPGRCSVPANAPLRVKEIDLNGSSVVIGRNPLFTGLYRDLALVGQIGEAIVVAVRGTQPPRITSNISNALNVASDWLNDGAILGLQSDDFEGFVHQGFASAAFALARTIRRDLGIVDLVKARAAAAGGPVRIIVTGHSKGGPVAQLLALFLRREPTLADADIEVVTFAAARPGDGTFKTLFEGAGIGCLRYETCYDIVPLLPVGSPVDPRLGPIIAHFGHGIPATTFGFLGLGQAVIETAQEAAEWEDHPPTRLFNIINRFGGDPLAEVVRAITAHSISAGSHYDRLVSRHATI